jgi:hexosaminidase
MDVSSAHRHTRVRRLAVALTVGAMALSSIVIGATTSAGVDQASAGSLHDVVPVPAEVEADPGDSFQITQTTRIAVVPGSTGAATVGRYLRDILRPATGYALPVTQADGFGPNTIQLLLSGADPRVGQEGYDLDVTADGVVLSAQTAAGLFAGIQTLRQVLPPTIEADDRQPGPWVVPGGSIVDFPRFAYRGAHLDVARHFFTVDEVKQYIDELALYKINTLHLHLTDDQGWRIQINSWPRLTTFGGEFEVGGTPGGYYTQADYSEIVAYAQSRFVTVIPEIDMPGHTNAALASYAELNCDGVAPPRRFDIDVGYSSLCVDLELTYQFVDDVIREVAALTPAPYIHIGGDEAHTLPVEGYIQFMDRAQAIVRSHGKLPIGWHQILQAPAAGTVAQYWFPGSDAPDVAAAAAAGTRIIMSPADHTYLDMKYAPGQPAPDIGLQWAGFIEVQDAYGWDPGTFVNGVSESSVWGPEAPLWSETLLDLSYIELMAFPRLPAIAELGWSPWSTHDWEDFRARLALQGPRWEVMGINFYRSPQIAWPALQPAA